MLTDVDGRNCGGYCGSSIVLQQWLEIVDRPRNINHVVGVVDQRQWRHCRNKDPSISMTSDMSEFCQSQIISPSRCARTHEQWVFGPTGTAAVLSRCNSWLWTNNTTAMMTNQTVWRQTWRNFVKVKIISPTRCAWAKFMRTNIISLVVIDSWTLAQR